MMEEDVSGRLPDGTGLSQAEPKVSALRASIPSAAQMAAEREAEKREKHKPRSLSHKQWAALHNSVKGWHVALIDCPYHAEHVARERAKQALRYGDFERFRELAADALMARVKATLFASGIEARSDETAQQAQPSGESPPGRPDTTSISPPPPPPRMSKRL